MVECRISKVTDENTDGLVALCERFAREAPVYRDMQFDEEGTREYLASFKDQSDYNMGFVAMLGDQVAGFLLVTMYKHPCLLGKATCDELMYTHPELRGVGVGGLLVEEYKEWAKALGANLVLLGSSSGINADFAEKFYDGHGFVACGLLAKLGDPDVRREDEPQES